MNDTLGWVYLFCYCLILILPGFIIALIFDFIFNKQKEITKKLLAYVFGALIGSLLIYWCLILMNSSWESIQIDLWFLIGNWVLLYLFTLNALALYYSFLWIHTKGKEKPIILTIFYRLLYATISLIIITIFVIVWAWVTTVG